MCDDAPEGVCATGSFLLGGFSGGMGGFVGMILNHPVVGVFGGVTLGVLAGDFQGNRRPCSLNIQIGQPNLRRALSFHQSTQHLIALVHSLERRSTCKGSRCSILPHRRRCNRLEPDRSSRQLG